MTFLILGVLLWYAAHLFKRLAPGPRAALGDTGKTMVSAALSAALILMVVGYRATAGMADLFTFHGNGHLNNLIMLVAVVVFGAGMAKGVLWTRIRHPMLMGTLLWAVAHLLVHNDLASVVLFGGMGLWAVLAMALINSAGPWQRPAAGSAKRDLALIAIALLMYGAITGVHSLLGFPPFQGSYG